MWPSGPAFLVIKITMATSRQFAIFRRHGEWCITVSSWAYIDLPLNVLYVCLCVCVCVCMCVLTSELV